MVKDAKNIFIVGIKGVAMANIAIILKKMGKQVTGSDVNEEFITDELLHANNILYVTSFAANLLPKNTDLLIYAASHKGEDNSQVVEAKRREITVLHQAAFIEELLKEFKTKIAVCGSHGKTTTASLLSYSLARLGTYPSYLVGTSSFSSMPGGKYDKRKYFVFEADEYAVNPPQDKTPKLNFYTPDAIIATNIDFDHPDVYQDFDQARQTFITFFGKRQLYLCKDDPELAFISEKHPEDQCLTFGFSESAHLVVSNVSSDEEKTSFELKFKKKKLGKFEIALFGKKNVSNVAGVILFLLDAGFNIERIRKSIQGFTGARRRFEKKAYIQDTYLFDDYAHHPIEIETTIQAARERFPLRRIIILFQPHTYSRTQALQKEFGIALAKANESIVLPIFASARENALEFDISSDDIAQGMQNIQTATTNKDAMKKLSTMVQKGDVILTMGAGDIYKLENDIIKLIKRL